MVLLIERVHVVLFHPFGQVQCLLHHRPGPGLIDLDVTSYAFLVAIKPEHLGCEQVGAVSFLRGSECWVVLGVEKEFEEVAGRCV